ncbi:MAG TPA: hypothetical protein H9786_10930 [Candidatus Brachybacterium merdavium]|uniref:Uncharacterized protein n=1 Tax=Candidatus Brachybacterium merdavium TaxID=2838513 RepID=A0A9D2LE83_9MICO|nr:hypothetical protein [Candidatus Brachybacterium merdavium]
MFDQLMILAESGAAASEGIPAPFVGIGVFIMLMALLGITYLTSGENQRKRGKTDKSSDR